MLRISNHTARRFAEKARFFRSLWAGRRCAAASRFTFFKGETLYCPEFGYFLLDESRVPEEALKRSSGLAAQLLRLERARDLDEVRIIVR
ncbi:MAG: hypothetical protein MSH25_05445, partial [Desulfovibrio sp.]|nr:hypothetical protein [Desulfovibrio sp.]